jgi:serine/threonine protein kinase
MWCPQCNRTWGDDARFCPRDGSRLSATANVEALSALPSIQSGVLLGARYEVRGFIGKGAMARVYLAQDLETREPVAVKVLDVLTHRDHEARERFMREATAIAGIEHPNIVKVWGTGERGDGAPYLVMEYLFGETLGSYLRRERRMPEKLAVPLLTKAGSALAAAHEVGVVHRDVKPDNLFLIGEPGEPYDIRLLDFGFARLRKSKMTAAGMTLGTAEYMSPEQGLSDPVDGRSDVYGLGAVLYRALTGEFPFTAMDDAEMIARLVLLEARPPKEVYPELSDDVAAIIDDGHAQAAVQPLSVDGEDGGGPGGGAGTEGLSAVRAQAGGAPGRLRATRADRERDLAAAQEAHRRARPGPGAARRVTGTAP